MKYWIEKTYSHKRSLEKGKQFKKVLLSPTSDSRGADIYKNMRNVKKDDFVLHLDQSTREIVGYSRVLTEYEEIKKNDISLYQIQLIDFVPYKPTIDIKEFFRDPSLYKELLSIKNESEVFYRTYGQTFALRQGAYLTSLSDSLHQLLMKFINRSRNQKIETVREIPPELLEYNNDISIILGQNGLGKSQLLEDLANHYNLKENNVIAISSSIYDKFTNSNKNRVSFHHLGGRNGPKAINQLLTLYLERKKLDDQNLLFNVLKYIGYSKKIGLQITQDKLKVDELTLIRESEIFSTFRKTFENEQEIFWIDENNYIVILNKLNKLKELFINNKIKMELEFFLNNNNNDIKLLYASSGELTLLTSFIHVSLYIREKSLILIDEPENSLHPKWQKEYINLLIDLFSVYKPKIVIATHSPILLSISDFMETNINYFSVESDRFRKLESKPKNHEALLLDVFKIITPENRVFTHILSNLLHDLEDQLITFYEFKDRIDKYKSFVYDNRQIELLDDITLIGRDISASTR